MSCLLKSEKYNRKIDKIEELGVECLKREEIYEYVKKQYGTIPEYLWKS